MPARNLQVYAKWAKPDYTVSFNTHGADTETPAPIGVAKYDTIEDQMPADPTREGYVFAGWYTDEAYTVPFVATQQIVRNLTLHAKWTRTDSCTYVIVAKDTEGNELKRVDGSEVEVGASVTVNAPVIDGYQAQQSSQNVKILDDGQEVVFVYAAVALGKLLLRDVKGQDDRAEEFPVGRNAADIELIHAARALGAHLTVAVRSGGLNGGADLVAACCLLPAFLPHTSLTSRARSCLSSSRPKRGIQ